MSGNSFHQQLAKKTSSTVVTPDLFVVWYLGLWNKCHLIHGSFSGNQEDPRTERTRSRLARALSKKRRIHLVIHGQRDLTQTEKSTIKMTGLTLYLQHNSWCLKTVAYQIRWRIQVVWWRADEDLTSSSLQALITNPSCRSLARQLKGEVTSVFIVNRFCYIPLFFSYPILTLLVTHWSIKFCCTF